MTIRILFITVFFLFSILTADAATQLFTENFDDQDWTDSDLYDAGGDGGEIVSVPAIARSGSYVVKFDGSQTTEGLFRNMTISGSGGEFYLKYYIYYPSPGWQWDNMSSTGLKNIRFYAGEVDFTYMQKDINEYPDLCDPGEFVIEFGQWGTWSNVRSNGIALAQNQWHEVIIYLHWYSNGTTTYSVSMGGNLHEATINLSLGAVNITMVQILSGNGFGRSGYYYVDDVTMWDGIPDETPSASTAAGVTFSGASFY